MQNWIKERFGNKEKKNKKTRTFWLARFYKEIKMPRVKRFNT